jgi:hypothetical protein
MTTAKDRPVYILKLRPEPQVVDPVRALRAVLKRLLRQHGFKCITVYEDSTNSAEGGIEPATSGDQTR